MKKKLNLDSIKVTSFITAAQTGSIKGGAESLGDVCVYDGSIYPTNCCITEYPTHPCTNNVICQPTTNIQVTVVLEYC